MEKVFWYVFDLAQEQRKRNVDSECALCDVEERKYIVKEIMDAQRNRLLYASLQSLILVRRD